MAVCRSRKKIQNWGRNYSFQYDAIQCTLQQAKTKFPLGRSFWELLPAELPDWDWLKLAQKPGESGGRKGTQLGRREGSGLTARYSKSGNAYQPVLPELARLCMAKKKQAGSLVCTLCTWVVNKITKKNIFLYHSTQTLQT